MPGMDSEKAALKSLMNDASAARLGPSRVAPDSGAAEVLRALGQQLMEQADALESGAESEMGSGEYELDDRD
jgi:hypothetical protein